MADYVRAHIHALDSILTDDQQGFSVMLLSGHPELFVDGIDKGDGYDTPDFALFEIVGRPSPPPGAHA
jgi:hypothetical protein